MTRRSPRHVLGELARSLRLALAPAPPSCPDAARLAGASPRERDAVAAHVAACSRCATILEALAVEDVPLPAGPLQDQLLARAVDMYRDRPIDVLRLAVRALADRLEVVELVGAVLAPAPVRGAPGAGLMVERHIGGRDVRAHLSYSARGDFAILLDMGADPRPDAPLRVSVWRDDRELASSVATDGRTMFSSLRPGRYRMHINEEGDRLLGRIDLDLEVP